VLGDPVDHIGLHAGHGGGVVVPLERAHLLVSLEDEVPASFRRMLTTIRSLGHTVRRLRVDNETVFLGVAFRNLLDEFNIAVEITAPYAHWQHGRIEWQWGKPPHHPKKLKIKHQLQCIKNYAFNFFSTGNSWTH
jgi:hypothetical protein